MIRQKKILIVILVLFVCLSNVAELIPDRGWFGLVKYMCGYIEGAVAVYLISYDEIHKGARGMPQAKQ